MLFRSEVPDHEINEEPPEDALIYDQPKTPAKDSPVTAATDALPKSQPESIVENVPTAAPIPVKTDKRSVSPLVADSGIWAPLYRIGDGFAAAISEPEKSFSSH